MYYVPQPIAIHTLQERQNFRRGNCSDYGNPVLYTAPNFIMPNMFIKRPTSGAAFTATLVNLNDVDVTALTIAATQVDYPLDVPGVYEMHVFESGSWAGALSLMNGGTYYIRLDDGDQTYYTDEFMLSYSDDGFPTNCGETWVKLSWLINGTCIVSGKSVSNEAEPIHAYPKVNYWHYVYLNANLSRPEWEYEEEGEDDAHSMPVIDTRRLVKRWTLEGMPVTESIYDAVTIASISDRVLLEFKDGTAFDYIKDVRTEVSWESGGCLANLKTKFSTDYFVKQGCC